MNAESGQSGQAFPAASRSADSPARSASIDAVPSSGPSSGLIDAVLEATAEAGGRSPLDRFLEESSPAGALRQWLQWTAPQGTPLDRQTVARWLNRDVALLDRVLDQQVNAVIHHPRFQQLEASWRGLHYLVEQADGAENVKIRVLGVSWKELARDAERAIEFDQSQLFRKVYSEEFDTPGGEPYGVLIGDYQIHSRPSAGHPTDDVSVLGAVSHVAAAAFAPFVAGVDPEMFGLDKFGGLEQPLDLSRTFDQLEYLKWNTFRQTEDSRFVGLTLPRVLMRLPYADDGSRADGFRFREDTDTPDGRGYLWGNAAYAFGGVLIRAFSETGWLANIRGARRGGEEGGIARALPVHCFSTDAAGVAPKMSTDVSITDYQEQELSKLGFIPLCDCRDTELSAFYTSQSVQKSKEYDDRAATMNARISAMLQYMLCVSRFAHYLKVAARDKIGAFTEAEECETYLHGWLQKYVTSDGEAAADVKAEYPLRQASVRVRSQPGKPGSYACVAHLWPHFELDELTSAVRITTELTPGRST